jgi:hypothetical protein
VRQQNKGFLEFGGWDRQPSVTKVSPNGMTKREEKITLGEMRSSGP